MKSGLLNIETSLLLIIDIQEKLLKAQFQKETVANKAVVLAKAAKILAIPVVVSEQYPQGLGSTIKEVRDELPENTKFFEKTSFNCCLESGFNETIKNYGRNQILICGMETHICVHQTVHNLISQEYEIHLIQDAITSRKEEEYKQGLARMINYGAIPSTVETALFELIKCTKHSQFKTVQSLIK